MGENLRSPKNILNRLEHSKAAHYAKLLTNLSDQKLPWGSLPGGFAIVDQGGTVYRANADFLRLLNAEDEGNTSLYDILDITSRNALSKVLTACCQSPGQSHFLPLKLKKKRANPKRVFAAVKLHKSNIDTYNLFSIIFLPQDALLPTKILRDLATHFTKLVEERLCHIIVRQDRKIIECDKTVQRILGFDPNQLVGTDFARLFSEPLDGLRIWSILKSCHNFEGKILAHHRDGARLSLHLLAKELPSPSKTQKLFLLSLLDLSQIDATKKHLKPTGSLVSLSKPFFQALRTIACLQHRSAEMNHNIVFEDLLQQDYLESLKKSVYPIFIVEKQRITFANEAFSRLFSRWQAHHNGNDIDMLLMQRFQFQPDLPTLLNTRQLPVHGNATLLEGERSRQFDLWVAPAFNLGHDQRMFCLVPSEKLAGSELSSEQMERLASLGQISTIIAHEIRNPLGSIRLNLQYLSQRIAIPDSYKKAFKDIEMGIYRIEKVIQSILDYTRPRTPEFQPFCLHEVLTNRIQAMNSELSEKDIRLTTKFNASQTTILGDPNLIDRVFANLLSNAGDAIEKDGQIEIETWNANGAIYVKIQDNGRGISPDVLPKIFEPFFTTKSEGVGIGLAIVKRILDLHQAKIEVHSESGKGATFHIRFSLINSGDL